MIETLEKIKVPYINKFPLGDSNKTDWNGLEQYIQHLFGEDIEDQRYALREVGNIFPSWVPIGNYNVGDIPPYIPRVRGMIAVQLRGQNAWHQYGFMPEPWPMREQEKAINDSKTYLGGWYPTRWREDWVHYDTTWKHVKWGKYYDGSDWITFWTLNPSYMRILSTLDLNASGGWTNVSGSFANRWIAPNSATGTGGATTHQHTTAAAWDLSSTLAPENDYKDNIVGDRVGIRHSHSGGTHTATTTSYYPNYVDYKMFQIPAIGTELIPTGGIAFWTGTSATVPSGWTYVSSANGYHLRVTTSGVGGTSAAANGSHAAGGTTTSGSSSTLIDRIAIGSAVANMDREQTHSHALGSTSHSAAHDHSGVTSPYFSVILMSADSDQPEIPLGGATVWAAAPPDILNLTWTRETSADASLLKADSTWGSTGGSSTHVHDHSGAYSSAASVGTNSTGSTSGTVHTSTATTHAHPISSADHASSTENSMPPYYKHLLYSRTT